jgi:dTDP-4-dehydrorhamnose 3,5-epimerase-like enzyme
VENSLDKYSLPLNREETDLAVIYSFNFRDSKRGRLFIPIYDQRFPLEFKVEYTYISKFLEKDNASGNHYHKKKQEMLIPLQGKFDIYLEDIKSKHKELIELNGSDNKGIYIRTGISHRIVSRDYSGIMLVLASTHSTIDDEIEYNVK